MKHYISTSTSQTATSPEDYSGTSPMTLEFSSSVVSITVPVTIVDDDILENPETFSAVLTTADTDVFLQPNEATVRVSDNDSKFFMLVLALERPALYDLCAYILIYLPTHI